MSVSDTRISSRSSAGVRLFNVAKNEHVVSTARIEDSGEDEAEAPSAGETPPEAAPES